MQTNELEGKILRFLMITMLITAIIMIFHMITPAEWAFLNEEGVSFCSCLGLLAAVTYYLKNKL
jgi:hypothetical protein